MRNFYRVWFPGALTLAGVLAAPAHADPGYVRSGPSVIVADAAGASLRITPYGPHAIRLQTVRKGEAYFPDNYYEMVEALPHGGKLGQRARRHTGIAVAGYRPAAPRR